MLVWQIAKYDDVAAAAGGLYESDLINAQI